MATTNKIQIPNTVFGKVTNNNGRPLANLKVEIYDVDMRNWQALTDTITDKNGKYELKWMHDQLSGRGVKEADIAVKVFTREKNTVIYTSSLDDVRFNASPREEINITINHDLPVEVIEFDFLVKQVTFLANKVPISDLLENQEHRDVTFLSKEMEVPADKIVHLIVAHRLHNLSKIDAAFFYALFRENTLLGNDFSKKMNARFSVGIGDDDQVLLFDAALTDRNKIETDIKKAIAGKIVSPTVANDNKRNLEILSRYKSKAEEYYKNEHPDKAINLVTNFFKNGKIQEIQQLFKDNKNDLNAFIGKITDPLFYNSQTEKSTNTTNIDFSKFFGFGNEIISQVATSKGIHKSEDISQLAKLNKAEWVEEITRARPDIQDKQMISMYGSAIVRQMEKDYPTIAYAAQLTREKNPALVNHDKIVAFFANHGEFDMIKHNVDLYLKDKNIVNNDTSAIKEELKSVQRIFRLTPNYSQTTALLNANINSSQSIVATGKTRFVNELAPKAGILPAQANAIFNKASTMNTAAMLMVGNLHDAMSVKDIASFETTNLELKLEAVTKDFPNLKSLFKLTDVCECEKCRSVYSPAAYLVEILQFLDKRAVVANNAKSVLFNRRPDLGEIDLGCANAMTPVKYIDLVCEILEEAVAPESHFTYSGNLADGADPLKGLISASLLNTIQNVQIKLIDQVTLNPVYIPTNYQITDKAYVIETGILQNAKPVYYLRDTNIAFKIVFNQVNAGVNEYDVYRLRQTFTTAEELDAAPEYENASAYFALKNAAYAFKLPFDLNHTEAIAYLSRFDVDRSALMKTFQISGTPSDEIIAAEKLGLTEYERKIITAAPAPNNNAAQQVYWNVPASGNVVDYLKEVDHCLDKSGLEYKELDLLLKLKFIDKNGNLFIKHKDLTCDTSQKEIANLDLDALDRIHRFLRLQKKTGWKFDLLDEIISQTNLGNGQLDNNCLIKAAQLSEISEKTAITLDELIGCFGEFPYIRLQENAPGRLYQQVFLNKAKNGISDKNFLPEKIDGSQLLSANTGYIATCLQLKETDLDFLITMPHQLSDGTIVYTNYLPDDKLNFSNLSYLYSLSRLIIKLRLKAEDIAVIKELSGIDLISAPDKTLSFLKVLDDLKNSPLTATDVKFMLKHEAANLKEREIKTDKVEALLGTLKTQYKSINDLQKSKFDSDLFAEDQKTTLQTELSKLAGISAEDTAVFLQFVDANWKFNYSTNSGVVNASANYTDANAYLTFKLGSILDISGISALLNPLDAAFTTATTANNNEHAALLTIQTANIAVSDATNPADLATAQTQLAAAQANELITSDAAKAANDALESKKLDLVKAFQDSISLFNINSGKWTVLTQTVSTTLKSDLDLTKIVLNHAVLKQPAPGTDLIKVLLSDNFNNAISIANYPKQYNSVELLYKLFTLINSFNLSNADVEWHLTNNANPALKWFEFDSIPYVTGQTAVDFYKYLKFTKIAAYTKQFAAVANPSDPENPVTLFAIANMILLTPGTAKRDDFLNALALLTGYEKTDLDAIDAYLFSVFNIANYNVAGNWDVLIECNDLVRKLGATVAQIIKYINPVLSAAEVSDLRTTLKSRYDEDTWLSTLKEIMDAIRPQKRDALIAYLLATNPGISDTNDLYEYFLIDVQMEACMPSSRIVQAHNTVQLFVQRCLMGLEPDAIADIDNDPDWNQWQWMKNYRVWEANRKVFLYPENWYDVTLADDKSFLLDEFINDIKQNELTNDTAEEAIKNYLLKLDSIAFLEVMATWYDAANKAMHVFARTKGGDPAIYYYRKFEQERYWTPWEKVEVDITGDHLLAFIRNNRLNLAWPVFTEDAQSDQESNIPSTTSTTPVKNDKPKKQLKIQLAISEYTDKKWQPKMVSRDFILTPDNPQDNPDFFAKNKYNLLYLQLTEQVMLFSSIGSNYEEHQINGIFDIAGCKGYPELVFQGNRYFPDFYPDFKDARLNFDRYFETPVEPNKSLRVSPDDLSVRNGISPFNYYKILDKTPGKFRLSYPHQFTTVDMIALIRDLFLMLLNSGNNGAFYKESGARKGIKLPLGTLLPYFMEDSNHAYVIIPGFYNKTAGGNVQFNDAEKRTVSDVFQLMEDVVNWYKKIVYEFQQKPPADTKAAIQMIITDADFQNILQEIKKYMNINFLLNLLVGKTGNADFDAFLEKVIAENSLTYGEQFKNMYHPLVCSLRSVLYKDGVPALMKRDIQLFRSDKAATNDKRYFTFKGNYVPNELIVPKGAYQIDTGKEYVFPVEDIDFSSDGSYSVYNWDLFFRVPLHIATSLTQNQRFEEALTWFHYMFNPTGALSGTGVQKFWVTKPFYLNQDADYASQLIDSLMYSINDKSNPDIKNLEFAVEQWRNYPFRPDVVARFRPVAYQKALLMSYIDNLTQWGDYLFRQDTMEAVAQATQMYILADKLLGPKPRIIPPVIKQPEETYNQIEAKIDSFGNALIELENILPDLSVLSEGGAELPPPPVTLSMLYFCIPPNDQMFTYWDTVADRLFKIRNCQNIDGVERSLALFAPPIDPAMLVRAAASGLSLSSILAGLNAPSPFYRFNVLSQKATELAQEVRALGSSLLQALEKKDAEALTLLRDELELNVLNAVTAVKKLQIDEANDQIEVLHRTKKVTEERQFHYSTIQKIIANEQLNLDKMQEANDYQVKAQIVRTVAGALRLIPEFHVGASGFGGSPSVVMQLGGSAISNATSIGADILNTLGSIASFEGTRAATLGGYDRRFEDWRFQARLASRELDSIDEQIAAANIRKEIAETELANHQLQIENAKKTDDFMRSKYTNKDLYDWMIGQISSVYFKSYKLAFDCAKKAERSYKFELGNDDTYISYGYWDSLKKGLLSADNLIHDIKLMETGYLDKNKRDYEITKHVSLAQLDPLALLSLQATGVCDFEIPEALYDMDFPGQYFRRLKSVSISLPCIAGPYTSVSAKLSLVKNKYRKNANNPADYAEDINNDPRFVFNIGAIQSIAASNSQNDSGLFELNFRDERYLPFENTGAISSWRLELPTEVRQFDYNTMADVVIHLKYTAREGGSGLKKGANKVLKTQLEAINQGLKQNGLHTALNMKHDLPNEWKLLKTKGTIDLTIDKSRLPYMVQPFSSGIDSVMFFVKVTGNPAVFVITIDSVKTNLSRIDELHLCRGNNSSISLDTPFTLAVTDIIKLEELTMIVKYVF
ncbi:MAG: neuraminidase-like domain-containing protein [Bacteroidota bacterium]